MEPLDQPERNESIERFAHDMAAARARSGISLSDLHESTKIATGILEEFEATGLLHNALFNSVYLRSFISTYAGTIGLDKQIALKALESALHGDYDGEVSRAVGGQTPAQRTDAGTSHPITPAAVDGAARSVDAADASNQASVDASNTSERERDVPTPAPSGASSTPSASSGTVRRRSYEPGVAHRFRFEPIRPEKPRRARDAKADNTAPMKAEISTAVRDYHEPTPVRGVIIPPNRVKTAVFIVLAAAITISAAILAFRISSSVPDAATAGASPTTSDTESSPETTDDRALDPGLRPLPPVVLDDTLTVTVIAAGGPLDPIRVRADRDLRRPFWINTNDSLVFRITNQIVLDSLLERTVVKVENVPYWPISGRTQSRLTITRDSVQHFVATLRGR